MDGNEQRRMAGAGQPHPVAQGNEGIGGARHHHPEPAGTLQLVPQRQRHLQHDGLLGEGAAPVVPESIAAMPGSRTTTGRVSPGVGGSAGAAAGAISAAAEACA